MEQKMRIALAEVNSVLEVSEEEVINKIPQKFKEYLQENMDKEYKANIIPGLAIFAQPISMEAKELLRLVYRDFLATKEEKEKLVEREKKILNKDKEDKIYKTVDVENLQKEKDVSNNFEKSEPINNLQITVIKENWYIKVLRKMKSLVNKLKL